MEPTFQEADTEFRKKLFTHYILGIALIATTLFFVKDIIAEELANRVGVSFIRYIESLEAAFLLLTVPAAIYLIWLGRRVIRDKRYPYVGMKVIRKTEILTEKKAISLGKKFLYLGIFAIVMIAGSIRMNNQVNSDFIADPFNYQPFFWINK